VRTACQHGSTREDRGVPRRTGSAISTVRPSCIGVKGNADQERRKPGPVPAHLSGDRLSDDRRAGRGASGGRLPQGDSRSPLSASGPRLWQSRSISSLMGRLIHPAAITVRRLVERFFARSEFVLRGRLRGGWAGGTACGKATRTRPGALLSCPTPYSGRCLNSDRTRSREPSSGF
jgi:hypothetical protein